VEIFRGRSPRPLVAPQSHIVWSRAWFGSRAAGGHEVLMSGELVAALRTAGVRGLTFQVAA